MEKVWTEDMGEISGFGGDYERGCRAMVLAGIKWLDENPKKHPQFEGFKGVFGLVMDHNDAAEELTKAIMDAQVVLDDGRTIRAGEEATGAMHHAAVQNCLAYRRLGWDEFCKQRRDYHKENPE